MELFIMCCIIAAFVMIYRWFTRMALSYMEAKIVKRPLTSGQSAWMRIGFAGLLYFVLIVMPPVTMGYTLKAAALINLAIQVMNLDKTYFSRRKSLFAGMKKALSKK
ncbi:hypothetical protein U0129_21770 [Enterobacter hormaechei]|uniref:hypothetical protein n=1 Tax=Enterobacter hormaechei TaxID=158836 RepID=UPI0039C38530